jgi:hypothetical protein
MTAPLSNYEATLRVRMISGACVLMQQMAIKATKEALRKRGLKVVEFSHRELAIVANEYAARNPELLNEAATLVERWRTEGHFGKRAQAMGNVLRLAPPAQSVRNPPQIRTLPASEAPEQRGIQR